MSHHAEPIERWSGLKSWLYSLIQGNAKRNSVFVEYAGIGPGDKVLDIGCGPGAALESAVAAGAERVVGIDPSPSMVKRAASRVPEAEVAEGSAERLDFEDETFTCVFSIAALHHWADRDGGISEVIRVLSPGGAFYLVDGELKPGKEGHGLTPEEAETLARYIQDTHDTPCRVESLRAGRSDYLVITGSK